MSPTEARPDSKRHEYCGHMDLGSCTIHLGGKSIHQRHPWTVLVLGTEYTLPLVFVPFRKDIRNQMPGGITLSGYMAERYHSKAVHGAYLFELAALSVLSTGVQLLAVHAFSRW